MSDEQISEYARKRAAGKARRAKRIERRETYFDLLASGYSVEQIAKAMGMSASAVRRAVGQAVAARRFDAPEEFAHLQMARLMKALRCADDKLDRGDTTAIAPFLQAMNELNRFYGVAAGPLRLAPSRAAHKKIPERAAAPLVLAAPPLEAAVAEAFESGAKEVLVP